MAIWTKNEDMPIWLESRELSKEIYRITRADKFSKDFQFVSQIRAYSGSVKNNITEGFERSGNKEFIQFLYIANGSCAETEAKSIERSTAFIIEEYDVLVSKLIGLSVSIQYFINYLKNSEYKGQKHKS